MFSPPATMNFTSYRFRLDSMDYKKLTRLHLKNPPSSGLKFLSKTLNIQRLVVVLREDVGGSLTTTLPRVNFLGVIAGILALVSILLPWWGITATGFGSSTSSMWGFFGGPSHNPDINNASGFSNTITTYSPIILALVLVGMVFHQTLTQHRSKGATSNQKA